MDSEHDLFSKVYTFEDVHVPKRLGLPSYSHFPSSVKPDDPGKWVFWLPDGWGQGVKTTAGGKALKCYVNPEGKMYYHKPDIEKSLGYKLEAKEKDVSASKGNPDNIRTAVPSWPAGGWLPTTWRIAFRRLPGQLHRIHIPPGQNEGFLYHRSCVESYIKGEKTQLAAFGSSRPQALISEEKDGGAPRTTAVKRKSSGNDAVMGARADRDAKLSRPPVPTRAVAQDGWAACQTAEQAKEALARFAKLLATRGFAEGTELVGLHGAAVSDAKVRGVYFRMNLDPNFPASYQKLVHAGASTARVGCDGVYITWDGGRKRWCIARSLQLDRPLPERQLLGFCEDPRSSPLISGIQGWWRLPSQGGGSFAASDSLQCIAGRVGKVA